MTITTKRMCAALIALGMLGLGSVFAGNTTNSTISYSDTFESSWIVGSNIAGQAGSWFSTANDASAVTNLGSTYVYTPASGCGKPITDTGSKVLSLSTGGDMLSNVFNSIDMSLGKVYLDTMVQFVAGDPPTACTSSDTGIKLAVFVYANPTGPTNLMIYGGTINPGSGDLLTNVIVNTGIAINPTDWHRLTVTFDATAEQSDPSGWPTVQMFQVKLDGLVITNTGGYAYNDGWKSAWVGGSYGSPNPLPTTSSTGSWFRSATKFGAAATQLKAVAFQGTGLIDDLVVTQTDPLPGSFIVTQTIGGNVSAVPSDLSITVAAGSSTSIVYTAAEWFRLGVVNQNGSQVNVGGERKWTNTFSTAGTSAAGAAVGATAIQVGLPSPVTVAWASGYYTNSEAAALANSQLAFDYNHGLSPLFHWYTIGQTVGAGGTASPAASAIYVAAGSTTSIVYTAAQWYRISSIKLNGGEIANSGTTFTKTFTTMAADATMTADFAAASGATVGLPSNVPASWATNYYSTEAAALADSNLAQDYMLNQVPTTTYTPSLTIGSLTVSGSSISVVVNLAGVAAGSTTIHGTLDLQGSSDLVTWTPVGSASITNAVFGVDGNSAPINFTDLSANSFYKAQIIP